MKMQQNITKSEINSKSTKRWVPKIQTESQELVEKISWNSSSSSDEYEEETNESKKFKSYFRSFKVDTRPPLAGIIKNGKRSSRKNEAKPDLYGIKSESPIISFLSSSPIITGCKQVEGNSPVLSQNHDVTSLKVESDSPILSQTIIAGEKSPILRNSKLLNRIQTKRKCINISPKNEPRSQDMFLSQATQVIEESDSPDSITEKVAEHSQGLNRIEIISTQDSSSIGVINCSTSDTSLQTIDSGYYYHQPNKKKKCPKKGGLLHQLNKTMSLQTSRVTLWHHDIFCKNIIPNETEHISCLVLNRRKDFGCIILECHQSESTESDNNLFLVCLGHNISPNLSCDIGQVIQVFPPYKEKLVQIQNKEMKFYYNISRILTDTEPLNKSSKSSVEGEK